MKRFKISALLIALLLPMVFPLLPVAGGALWHAAARAERDPDVPHELWNWQLKFGLEYATQSDLKDGTFYLLLFDLSELRQKDLNAGYPLLRDAMTKKGTWRPFLEFASRNLNLLPKKAKTLYTLIAEDLNKQAGQGEVWETPEAPDYFNALGWMKAKKLRYALSEAFSEMDAYYLLLYLSGLNGKDVEKWYPQLRGVMGYMGTWDFFMQYTGEHLCLTPQGATKLRNFLAEDWNVWAVGLPSPQPTMSVETALEQRDYTALLKWLKAKKMSYAIEPRIEQADVVTDSFQLLLDLSAISQKELEEWYPQLREGMKYTGTWEPFMAYAHGHYRITSATAVRLREFLAEDINGWTVTAGQESEYPLLSVQEVVEAPDFDELQKWLKAKKINHAFVASPERVGSPSLRDELADTKDLTNYPLLSEWMRYLGTWDVFMQDVFKGQQSRASFERSDGLKKYMVNDFHFWVLKLQLEDQQASELAKDAVREAYEMARTKDGEFDYVAFASNILRLEPGLRAEAHHLLEKIRDGEVWKLQAGETSMDTVRLGWLDNTNWDQYMYGCHLFAMSDEADEEIKSHLREWRAEFLQTSPDFLGYSEYQRYYLLPKKGYSFREGRERLGLPDDFSPFNPQPNTVVVVLEDGVTEEGYEAACKLLRNVGGGALTITNDPDQASLMLYFEGGALDSFQNASAIYSDGAINMIRVYSSYVRVMVCPLMGQEGVFSCQAQNIRTPEVEVPLGTREYVMPLPEIDEADYDILERMLNEWMEAYPAK